MCSMRRPLFMKANNLEVMFMCFWGAKTDKIKILTK